MSWRWPRGTPCHEDRRLEDGAPTLRGISICSQKQGCVDHASLSGKCLHAPNIEHRPWNESRCSLEKKHVATCFGAVNVRVLTKARHRTGTCLARSKTRRHAVRKILHPSKGSTFRDRTTGNIEVSEQRYNPTPTVIPLLMHLRTDLSTIDWPGSYPALRY